jgi:hypothetical protein
MKTTYLYIPFHIFVFGHHWEAISGAFVNEYLDIPRITMINRDEIHQDIKKLFHDTPPTER